MRINEMNEKDYETLLNIETSGVDKYHTSLSQI